MRTLGLVGGVTWRSSAEYYRRINEGVAAALGPYHSSEMLMRSVDYDIVRRGRDENDWRRLRRLVVESCRQLKAAGAEGIVLCSNSLHGVAEAVESELGLPLLHIAEALAAAARAAEHTKLAFFGTRFTMAAPFYRERLAEHGITMLVPDLDSIDHIIMNELARGIVTDASRQVFMEALKPLLDAGATAMVLGCTEIGMLIQSAPVPIFDTLALHADAAVEWQLGS